MKLLNVIFRLDYFNLGILSGFAIAFLAAVGSLFINSPYGRFASNTYGMELDPRFGWWLMEIMATVSFIYHYIRGPRAFDTVPMIFACLYLLHYANRGWYFPLSLRVHPGAKSSFSILVVASGVVVTSLHGYLNAKWYSEKCDFLNWDWMLSPSCVLGLLLYQVSFWSTVRCEHIIRQLRNGDCTNANRYKIPRGFLFEYVSSPQYLTELAGFLGWTIMTLNPAGLVILFISMANLIPRALSTHKWYQSKFEDYPSDRRALIPFVL